LLQTKSLLPIAGIEITPRPNVIGFHFWQGFDFSQFGRLQKWRRSAPDLATSR